MAVGNDVMGALMELKMPMAEREAEILTSAHGHEARGAIVETAGVDDVAVTSKPPFAISLELEYRNNVIVILIEC